MVKKPLLVSIGAIAAVLLTLGIYRMTSGSGPADQSRSSVPLTVTEAPRSETVQDVLRFTGDLAAIRQATIVPKVNGTLEDVLVNIGSFVRAGQLLALIDTTELRQQYQQAAATFENARLSFERTRELAERNLVSRQEIDNSEAAMRVARANYELASTRLGYTRVVAPFSGYITRRFLDPGSVVTPGSTTLFTIMDLDEMKVLVSVQEKDLPRVTPGKKAVITVDAYPGKEFSGTVRRMSQAVDLATRTMLVEIDIPNPGSLLKPGMYAGVSLLVAERPAALTVPTQAIFRDDAGPYLFVAERDTARRRAVVTGIDKGDRTEITRGLRIGEQVIVAGQQFVRDGSPVRKGTR